MRERFKEELGRKVRERTRIYSRQVKDGKGVRKNRQSEGRKDR